MHGYTYVSVRFYLVNMCLYLRERDGQMEPLSQSTEHDERFGRESASADGTVGFLIAARWTLAAKTATWKLMARPTIPTHTRYTTACPPVIFTAFTCKERTPLSN